MERVLNNERHFVKQLPCCFIPRRFLSLSGFLELKSLNYWFIKLSSVLGSRNWWVSTPAIKFIVLNRPTLANPSGTIRSVDKGIYSLLALPASKGMCFFIFKLKLYFNLKIVFAENQFLSRQ